MPLTKEQLEQRLSGIGSSDIGAVVGLNPYRGPHDVWAEKLGISEPFEGNAATEFGRLLEPVLLKWWQEQNPEWKCVPNADKDGNQVTTAHPDAPWMLCTEDARAFHHHKMPILVEAKTANWRVADRWGEEGTDDVPEEYLCQVAWQMAVLDIDVADIVALIDGEFRIYRILRRMDFERALIAKARAFWFDHVVAKVAPPIDSSDACMSNLAFRNRGGDYLTDNPEADDLMEKIAAAKYQAEEWAAKEKTLRARLMEIVGEDHKGYKCGVGSAFWVERKPTWKTDWESIARMKGVTQEEIDAASHMTKGSKYPQVRLKGEKK